MDYILLIYLKKDIGQGEKNEPRDSIKNSKSRVL